MTTTIRPDTRPSHGYSVSGTMYCERNSVTRPRATTPAVWVTVTVAPRNAAWRAVPRDPIRYAATMDLPCPGLSAWSAPHAIASISASAMNPGVRLRCPTSEVNPDSDVTTSTPPEGSRGATTTLAPDPRR